MNKKTKLVKNQVQLLEIARKSKSAEEYQVEMMDALKTAALEFASNLLQLEVISLCGEKYSRERTNLRAGSDSGRFVVNGIKQPILKPRVRNRNNEEVYLESYEKLNNQDLLDKQISDKMLHGVSCRDYSSVINHYAESTGISKSSISRAFNRDSKKTLDKFNTSDLSEYKFAAVAIDGVEINEKMMIICLGITDEMKKIPIGIREGSTENGEVVKDLLSSLLSRNFTKACDNLLFLLDGSKALKKGVLLVFGKEALIQRCWLHKSRNIKAYLPESYQAQAHFKLKAIMHMNHYQDAKKAYDLFYKWLDNISTEAANSLQEAGEDLLTLHKLGVIGELRKSLASTNMIESLNSTVRYKSYRVKNWNSPEQSSRWIAFIISHAQTKFKRLRGSLSHAKILLANLNNKKTVDSLAA
jgi:transposase-like protein